jgi:hypothetical protein
MSLNFGKGVPGKPLTSHQLSGYAWSMLEAWELAGITQGRELSGLSGMYSLPRLELAQVRQTPLRRPRTPQDPLAALSMGAKCRYW